jgi:hypothetical protein
MEEATKAQETPVDWFEQVCTAQARGRGGKASAMGEFRKALKSILIGAVDPANRSRITLVNSQPALRAGNVANSLKRLFPHIKDDQAAYARSYRYLRSMQDTLENWGWTIGEHGDKKHLILVDSEKFKQAYVTPLTPQPAETSAEKTPKSKSTEK